MARESGRSWNGSLKLSPPCFHARHRHHKKIYRRKNSEFYFQMWKSRFSMLDIVMCSLILKINDERLIMRNNFLLLSVTAILSSFFSVAAIARDCMLENRGSFAASVRIYDENTGNLKWSGQLNPKGIARFSVSGDRFIYEYKYQGDKDFHSRTGAWCSGGPVAL